MVGWLSLPGLLLGDPETELFVQLIRVHLVFEHSGLASPSMSFWIRRKSLAPSAAPFENDVARLAVS
jgi:hypothetical protein